MLSNTKIKARIRRKTNPELAETISKGRINKPWTAITKILSSSTKKQSAVNLNQIDKESTAGDTIIIPGKVLSKGTITKKVRIVSLSISAKAKAKLKETKSEYVTILEEIKKNPKAEGVKILR